MTVTKWHLLILGAFNIFVFWLLLSGSEILIREVSWLKGFPTGNLLTWLFLIAFPLNFMVIAAALDVKFRSLAGKGFFILSGIAIALGICWGVFARLLTTNWQFVVSNELSFPELRMQLFWIYSFTVPVLPIVGTMWFWIARIFSHRKSA